MVYLIKTCLLLSVFPLLGAYRRFHGSAGGAAGGHVLRQTQHAHQRAERQVGAGPLGHQELHRHQGGHPAILPGGKVWGVCRRFLIPPNVYFPCRIN